LTTKVMSLKQAVAGPDPAILISADGWGDKSIPLPISGDKGRIDIEARLPDNKPTTLTLDPAVQFGSLQTVFDGKRTLLIATSNGAPQQLDELLGWLGGGSGRWSGLDGRAIISVPGQAPVTVPNEPPRSRPRSPTPAAERTCTPGRGGWPAAWSPRRRSEPWPFCSARAGRRSRISFCGWQPVAEVVCETGGDLTPSS